MNSFSLQIRCASHLPRARGESLSVHEPNVAPNRLLLLKDSVLSAKTDFLFSSTAASPLLFIAFAILFASSCAQFNLAVTVVMLSPMKACIVPLYSPSSIRAI